MMNKKINLLIMLFIIFLAGKVSADPLDNWHWRNPLPQGNYLGCVVYGNNTFVAVGGAGTILTSSNGITWTIQNSGGSSNLYGIIYKNNIFVAVGNSGTILTSTDSITWTIRSSGTSNNLNRITYGNNTFVSVGSYGTILTSSDGITWTNRSLATSDNISDITYGNNTFVSVGSYGTILTSSNGITWTNRSSGYNSLIGITYRNNTFVAVGAQGTILTSSNGIIWTNRSSGTSNCLYGITYDNNKFVVVGEYGVILNSIDGITWTDQNSGTSENLRDVTYSNNTFVVVGYNGIILTSSDGIIWTKQSSGWTNRSFGDNNHLFGVMYINEKFIAVGGDYKVSATILTSSDGLIWSIQSLGSSNHLNGITHGNNTFVAVGEAGTILTSSDGITWTNRSSETSNNLNRITYGNNTFVAVGNSGTILTSADGITWTNRSSETTNDLYGITYGNNKFVAVVDTHAGVILTSPDGVTWSSQSSGTTDRLFGVTYGNNTFVAVGEYGRILTSFDGITWTSRNYLGVSIHLEEVIFRNNTFVVVGGTRFYKGTIFTSPDGIAWTSRNSGSDGTLYGIAYGNNTFVAVGVDGRILQSDPIVSSPPTAPSINLPGTTSEPGQVISTTTPTFQWNNVSEATQYGLYVSKYPYSSTNIVYSNTSLTGTSFTIPSGNLVNSEKYRWNIKAFNSVGESGVSNSLYFKVNINNIPTAPTITLPGTASGPGADISTTVPTFQWSSVTGATRYGLYISKDPYGTANIIYTNTSLTDTSFTIPSGKLVNGEKYRWNMTAFNGVGGSGISNTLYFKVNITSIPSVPTISSPGTASEPGEEISTTSPKLQWMNVSNAASYGIYIYDLDNNNIYSSTTITGTSFTMPGGYLVDGGKYYWNMIAFNSIGQSAISEKLYFNVRLLNHFDITAEDDNTKNTNSWFSINIVAKDAYENIVTGFNGKIFLSTNIGQVINPVSCDLFNGSAVLNYVEINKPGINIEILANGNGKSGKSNPFEVIGTSTGLPLISGVVKNTKGERVSNADIYLKYGETIDSCKTDVNGNYYFEDLQPGQYTIYASFNEQQRSKDIPILLPKIKINFIENLDLILLGSKSNPNALTPVLLIPGIMGSSTIDGIIPTLPAETVELNTSKWANGQKVHWGLYDNDVGWEKLVKRFHDAESTYAVGSTIYPVPYDWRREINCIVDEYLIPKIEEAKDIAGVEKVNIIAHSMGGLVVRAYIQRPDYKNDIDKFAMVGTPNDGGVLAYYLWEGGDLTKADKFDNSPWYKPVYKSVFTELYNNYYGSPPVMLSISSTDFRGSANIGVRSQIEIPNNLVIRNFIRDNVKSIRELLPTKSFLQKPINSLAEEYSIKDPESINTTLINLNDSLDFKDVNKKVFLGINIKTIQKIIVGNPIPNFYEDGAPDGDPIYSNFNLGDGTVLKSSVTLDGQISYDDITTDVEHMKLIDIFTDKLFVFITDETLANYTINPSRIQFNQDAINNLNGMIITVFGQEQPYIVDPLGRKSGIDPSTNLMVDEIPDSIISMNLNGGGISIKNAINGLYTLSIKGLYNEDYRLMITYTDDKKAVYQKYYGFNHANTTSFTFTVDSNSTDKIIINKTPLPPKGLEANAIESNGLKTRLTWPEDLNPDVTSFNIYSKEIDEPYFSQLGSTSGTYYDLSHLWAKDSSIKTHLYAISSVKADDTESFLSEIVRNDDRDHDGLTDEKELLCKTHVDNPDSDNDGLNDGEEYIYGTNPLLIDTDGDTYSDYMEMQWSSDPRDVSSTPKTPNISIEPNSYDFDTVKIGRSKLSQTFIISNTGTGNLKLDTVTIVGDDAYEFNIKNDNCSGQIIAPSASGTFDVMFFPSLEGIKKANLNIPSNDPYKNLININLTGKGIKNISPTVTLDGTPSSGNVPSTVDFTANASDPDGNIVKYEWDFDGNGVYDSTTVNNIINYTYNVPAKYNPKVRVTDNDGAMTEAGTTIEVTKFTSNPLGNIDTTSPGSENRIDGHDLYVLSKAFGSNSQSISWNPAADLDGNNIVDGNDLVILAGNFGKRN